MCLFLPMSPMGCALRKHCSQFTKVLWSCSCSQLHMNAVSSLLHQESYCYAARVHSVLDVLEGWGGGWGEEGTEESLYKGHSK